MEPSPPHEAIQVSDPNDPFAAYLRLPGGIMHMEERLWVPWSATCDHLQITRQCRCQKFFMFVFVRVHPLNMLNEQASQRCGRYVAPTLSHQATPSLVKLSC